MAKKHIPRKFKDILHVAIFLAILFAFANYESERKDSAREQAAVPNVTDFSKPSLASLRSNITTWK